MARERSRSPNAKVPVAPCAPGRTWIDVRMPAKVGQRIEDLDTPCLLVDLDAFDSNCTTMNSILKPFASKGVRLRPHAKPHKSSSIASRQLRAHGELARGVCCQTVAEAEVMARNGVRDVFVTNIVADPMKASRVTAVSLCPDANVIVCVDSRQGLALFQEALKSMPGSKLSVMIELGVASRTGVDPTAVDDTVCMAREIVTTSGMRLRGLQVYNGLAQHLRTATERMHAILESNAIAQKHLHALESSDIPGVDVSELIVSGGGTGTLPLEVECGCWRELQAGSYIFNDRDYSDNKDMANWRQSLFVLGTIIGGYSRPGAIAGPHVIVDVGLKAVAFDSGPPVPLSPMGQALEYVNLGDEHGAVRRSNASNGTVSHEELAPGTKIKLIPGHCDPTVNLYDFLVGVRGGVVEEIFRVDGRSY